jgi:hypothetical protein
MTTQWQNYMTTMMTTSTDTTILFDIRTILDDITDGNRDNNSDDNPDNFLDDNQESIHMKNRMRNHRFGVHMKLSSRL